MMARIWRAPSEARTAGGAGGVAAGLAGAASRGPSRRAARVSADKAPWKSRLKKQRKARAIRFKCLAPSIQDSGKAGDRQMRRRVSGAALERISHFREPPAVQSALVRPTVTTASRSASALGSFRDGKAYTETSCPFHSRARLHALPKHSKAILGLPSFCQALGASAPAIGNSMTAALPSVLRTAMYARPALPLAT